MTHGKVGMIILFSVISSYKISGCCWLAYKISGNVIIMKATMFPLIDTAVYSIILYTMPHETGLITYCI